MISVAFQAVFVIVGTVGSTYLKNARTYFMAFNLAISLVGSVMVRQLDPTSIWPRFFGYCLCIAYSAVHIYSSTTPPIPHIGGFE